MALHRDDIRAKCGRIGVEEVQRHLKDRTYFNNDKEFGWAQEWLDGKQREEEFLNIARDANAIAKDSASSAKISAFASAISAAIALLAIIIAVSK